jgi:hypothetical protein
LLFKEGHKWVLSEFNYFKKDSNVIAGQMSQMGLISHIGQ